MSADLAAVEDVDPIEALIERALTEPWSEGAVCASVDPELWFPEQGTRPKEPARLCRTCPVMAECRADALIHHEQWGIWGGMTEKERKRAWRNRPSRDAALAEALAHVETLNTHEEDPPIEDAA